MGTDLLCAYQVVESLHHKSALVLIPGTTTAWEADEGDTHTPQCSDSLELLPYSVYFLVFPIKDIGMRHELLKALV